MASARPIVTVTLNPAVDLSTTAPALIPQRKLRCETPSREPGGGGINIARVVRALGGDARAVFTAGGVTGELLRALLERAGLDHHAVSIADETRENIAITDAASGSLYRFVMPGPTLTADEFAAVGDAVRDALRGRSEGAMLAISGSMCGGAPPDLFDDLVPRARAKGVRVFADVSGAWLERAARAGVSFLKPNQHELEEFAGRGLESDADIVEAARSLRDMGDAEAVMVSLGSKGILCVTDDRWFRVDAPPVRVVSTIGAGDSAVAGVVLSLARGASLEDAVRLGVAAGAATCMTPGTQLCARQDVERIAALIG